jgi:hypothetical protein
MTARQHVYREVRGELISTPARDARQTRGRIHVLVRGDLASSQSVSLCIEQIRVLEEVEEKDVQQSSGHSLRENEHLEEIQQRPETR